MQVGNLQHGARGRGDSNAWTFAVGFATFFERRFRRRLPQLRHAYATPSRAVAGLIGGGHELSHFEFDTGLTPSRLDDLAAKVDLFYLCSHGGPASDGYKTAVTSATEDWIGLPWRLGHGGPRVAILDSCDLAAWNGSGWELPWKTAEEVGLDLRLILGFGSPATIRPETSGRATGFVRLALAGVPLAAAWLDAVSENAWPGLDYPVAIALGDDEADAQAVAHTATLDNFPAPRTRPVPTHYVLPEH